MGKPPLINQEKMNNDIEERTMGSPRIYGGMRGNYNISMRMVSGRRVGTIND